MFAVNFVTLHNFSNHNCNENSYQGNCHPIFYNNTLPAHGIECKPMLVQLYWMKAPSVVKTRIKIQITPHNH